MFRVIFLCGTVHEVGVQPLELKVDEGDDGFALCCLTQDDGHQDQNTSDDRIRRDEELTQSSLVIRIGPVEYEARKE